MRLLMLTLVLCLGAIAASAEPFAGLLSDDFEGASYVPTAALPSPPWTQVVGNVSSEIVSDMGNQAVGLSSSAALTQLSGGWWQISGYPAPQGDTVEIGFRARVDENGSDESGAVNVSVGTATSSGNAVFTISLKRTSAGTASLVANDTGTDGSVSNVVLANGLQYGVWHSIVMRTTANVREWVITLNDQELATQPQTQNSPGGPNVDRFDRVDDFILIIRTFGGTSEGTVGLIDDVFLRDPPVPPVPALGGFALMALGCGILAAGFIASRQHRPSGN